MSLYDVLLIVHIFSAIIGLGPGFIMTFIAVKSNTRSELKHAFFLRKKIHIFIMVGAILLLVTGTWMGIINPILFTKGWYVISIILYFITLAGGPLLLRPIMKPIREILANGKDEEVPAEYHRYARKLFLYERITNAILIIIIALMIIKPF